MGVLQYSCMLPENSISHRCILSVTRNLMATHFSLPSGENEMVIMRPGNKYEYKFGFELPQGYVSAKCICGLIFPSFDHLLFLESIFKLIVSFFLIKASGNIFQRKIWVCRLLGEGFSWSPQPPNSGDKEKLWSDGSSGCQYPWFTGEVHFKILFFWVSGIISQVSRALEWSPSGNQVLSHQGGRESCLF